MNSFLCLILSDFVQRTRSYSFLIVLCAALALGYSFVPPESAEYTTIRFGTYTGEYDSIWVGYLIAIMSAIFISLLGYFVINNSIKKDADYKVNVLVATTPTSDLKWLLSKFLSNFLVLVSLSLPVVFLGLILCILYNKGQSVSILDFTLPYILVCLPIFGLISGLAIILEALFGNKRLLQYISFFILFLTLVLLPSDSAFHRSIDPIGHQIITYNMEQQLQAVTTDLLDLNIGFVPLGESELKRFSLKRIQFPTSYLLARFAILSLGLILTFLTARFFKRLRTVPARRVSNNNPFNSNEKSGRFAFAKTEILNKNQGSFPLIKSELLLNFRDVSRWVWILTIGGLFAAFIVTPDQAHQYVLPILWLLHITTWSRLTTRSYEHGTTLYGLIAHQPIKRVFTSKVLAGVLWASFLALPVIVRLLQTGQYASIMAVLLGATILVALASLLGLLSKGRKLFELVFFLLIYISVNGLSIVDFYGALHSGTSYIIVLGTLAISLLTACYLIKSYRINHQ